MSIPYEHTVVVTRLGVASDVAARDDFGQPTTPAANTTIYNDNGDFQDMNFEEIKRQTGDDTIKAAGWIYFPEESFPATIRTDDRASVTGEGVSVQGVIVKVDRLSYRVLLKIEAQPTAA